MYLSGFMGSHLVLADLPGSHEPCRRRHEEAYGAVHPVVPPRSLGAYNPARSMEKPGDRVRPVASSREGNEAAKRRTRKREFSRRSSAGDSASSALKTGRFVAHGSSNDSVPVVFIRAGGFVNAHGI